MLPWYRIPANQLSRGCYMPITRAICILYHGNTKGLYPINIDTCMYLTGLTVNKILSKGTWSWCFCSLKHCIVVTADKKTISCNGEVQFAIYSSEWYLCREWFLFIVVNGIFAVNGSIYSSEWYLCSEWL